MHTYRRAHIVLPALLLLALSILPGAGPAAAGAEPEVTRAFITAQFLKYDPEWLTKRAPRAQQLERLQQRLYEIQARGYAMQCSAQLLNETDWVLDSTAEFTRADKNLWFLALSLGNTDQGFALEQMAADGSWGLCYDEWFKKLDAMIGALNRFAETNTPPKYTHLDILRRISTPELMRIYLTNLRVSNIAANGVNFRDELNATASLVAEALYKEKLNNYISHYMIGRPIAPAYIKTFNDFIEDWQDPQTGYWGAWYEADGRVLKSRDLSMTYHLVAYRRGEVNHWDRIFDTTLDIADGEYPFGWLQEGALTNHHAYDVARILKLGWNRVSQAQRDRAKPALQRLLAFALDKGLNADNSVTPQARFSDGIDDAYYYAASLLTTIGYCSSAPAFWTDAVWPEAAARCCGLTAHIEALSARTPTVEAALERMRDARASCALPTPLKVDETIDALKLDDHGGR